MRDVRRCYDPLHWHRELAPRPRRARTTKHRRRLHAVAVLVITERCARRDSNPRPPAPEATGKRRPDNWAEKPQRLIAINASVRVSERQPIVTLFPTLKLPATSPIRHLRRQDRRLDRDAVHRRGELSNKPDALTSRPRSVPIATMRSPTEVRSARG